MVNLDTPMTLSSTKIMLHPIYYHSYSLSIVVTPPNGQLYPVIQSVQNFYQVFSDLENVPSLLRRVEISGEVAA